MLFFILSRVVDLSNSWASVLLVIHFFAREPPFNPREACFAVPKLAPKLPPGLFVCPTFPLVSCTANISGIFHLNKTFFPSSTQGIIYECGQ